MASAGTRALAHERFSPVECEASCTERDILGGKRSLETLVPVLDETDPELQVSALESLRWLSQTNRNPAALERTFEVLESALDPAVERAAMEVLIRYGEPKQVMSAIQELAVTEGPNQDLAVREWIRIRDEDLAAKDVENNGDSQLTNN